MADIDYSPTITFLAAFFQTTTCQVEIRALPQESGAGPARPRFSRDGEIVCEHLVKWDQPERAVYFGVCTRIPGRPTGRRGSLAELPALWCDIDCYKSGITKEQAVAAALSLPLRPSLLVDSGGGIHCYWLLREALNVNVESDSRDLDDDAIVAVLKQLAGVLAGDPGVCDLARVMRLPGTHNTKGGGWRRCFVLDCSNDQLRYEFSDIVEMLDVQRPLLVSTISSGAPCAAVAPDDPFLAMARLSNFKTPIDVEARLAAMRVGANGEAAVHPTQCSVSSSLAARGVSHEEIFDLLLRETHRVAVEANVDWAWNWKREEAKIRGEVRSAIVKYAPRENEAVHSRPSIPRAELRVIQGGSTVAKTDDALPPIDPEIPEIPDEPTDAKIKARVASIIKIFNERYAVVNEEGRAMVYEATRDARMNRSLYRRITFEDLKKFFLNAPVYLGETDPRRGKPKPIVKTTAEIWLSHRERKQYLGGVTFDPRGGGVPSVLNLWRGFAVTPAPGSWQLMQDHIFEVICSKDMECFQFLMGWMARLVQFPAHQGEVAVVMRSTAHGAGKGTLARALMHILGQHSMAISDAKLLTGAFNGHLRDCVFLFADEAFWAGDKQHLGVLKSLITEPYLTIEAKFQTPVQAPNFIHLMMASNDEWVVPAALTDRRFFVLDVPDIHARDERYFAAIAAEMANGGYEAMLHDLLTRDLSNYNPRAIPQTAALSDQRSQSLSVIEEWWQTVLHQGYVWRSKLGLEKDFADWMPSVSTELLFASYLEFAQKRRSYKPVVRVHFGRFMKRVGGKPIRETLIAGEHIVSVESIGGIKTREPMAYIKERCHGYFLGSLKEARTAFDEATRIGPEWDDDLPGQETE